MTGEDKMNEDPKKSAEEAAARADAEKDMQAEEREPLPWSDPDYGASDPAENVEAEAHLAELEQLRAENAELREKILHGLADMENLRRRTEREKQDAGKYAISKFAQDIVGVADNLARAIQSLGSDTEAHNAETVSNLISGVEMTDRELHNVLSRHGVTKLDPMGEKFDPNFHQAMFEVENKDVPNGTVTQVVQAGYQIGERVLRPAMVGVAKGGPKAEAAPAETPQETAQPAPGPSSADDETVGHTIDKTA